MEPDWKAEAERLRAKLDMVTHYLELCDLYYHAHGADYKPEGWDITVREMVHRLKDGEQKPTDQPVFTW